MTSTTFSDEDTPVAAFPVGSKVVLLDAWMRNPRVVTITKHASANHIISEDARGVVYFANITRISGKVEDTERSTKVDWAEFADVLG